TSPNLGVYQTSGNVLSVGTFNEYTNRFFEDVSPSLDGMLFHEFVLAGGYDQDQRPHHDWIYPQEGLDIDSNKTINWEFCLTPFEDKKDFYLRGLEYGHANFSFQPMVSQKNEQKII